MDATLRQLLQQIVTHPADDTVRLVYADRCDELGEHDRAEFVRVQCELAKWVYADGTGCVCEKCEDLRRRERALMTAVNVCDWSLGISGQYCMNEPPRVGKHRGDGHGRVEFTFTRGFISSVTCTAEDFLKHADKLIWHPEMMDECQWCKGDGYLVGSTGMIVDCMRCERGRIPRPMPDTAQPIEKVVLTTAVRSSGRSDHVEVKPPTPHPMPLRWYQQCWRGVEFELPGDTWTTTPGEWGIMSE